MEMSFKDKELACELNFRRLCPPIHACTPENFDIIFTCRKEYEAGMGIFGVCCKLFPQVHVYTFQIMSNHIHFVASGEETAVEGLFMLFIQRLQKWLEANGRLMPLNMLKLKITPIETLEHFRAALAYVNRNGFVAVGDCSPFSYPWGANSCYFNETMRNYYMKCRDYVPVIEVRKLIHSKIGDKVNDLYSLDGCISPLSFCYISEAEKLFRDEKHYFYQVSKNVEAYGRIARDIGETICYTDEDLYQIARKIASESGGDGNLSLLDSVKKIDLARKLHYEYNAGKKQIHRLLKIDLTVLDSMF